MAFSDTSLEREDFKNISELLVNLLLSRSIRRTRDSVSHSLMPDLESSTESLMPDVDETLITFLISPFPKKLNPSGFDPRVGEFVAESDTFVASLSEEEFFQMKPTRLKEGQRYTAFPNESGEKVCYYTTYERVSLPSDLEIIVDSRSTTGRVGCMSHQVGQTSWGAQIIALQPFSFPITFTSGKTELAQAIVRYKGTEFIDYKTLKKNDKEITFTRGDEDVFQQSLEPKGLVLTFATHLVYRAKKYRNPEKVEPIDMDTPPGSIDPTQYFEIIEGNNKFDINPRTLYLPGSQEFIGLGNVCGRITREESDMAGSGLWSHFAGFVHPRFFGQLTFECYSHTKRTIKKGQRAAFIIFDQVEGEISNPYSGSYQHQKAPRLAKMFKEIV